MKVLVTGKGSYIGEALMGKIRSMSGESWTCRVLDVQDDEWRSRSFKEYDAIVHVAGLTEGNSKNTGTDEYFRVNAGLTLEIAEKAKEEGVKQFVFLSSMSVYGEQAEEIRIDTPLNPTSAYGKSKLRGEEGLRKLEDRTFSVAVLRPPMVYGRGCPGPYRKLSKLAGVSRVFPATDNKRSMIYIEHLTECMTVVLQEVSKGVFLPQNPYFTDTGRIVEAIRKAHGKETLLLGGVGRVLKKLKRFKTVRRIFGDSYYSPETMIDKACGGRYTFEETIMLTECDDINL